METDPEQSPSDEPRFTHPARTDLVSAGSGADMAPADSEREATAPASSVPSISALVVKTFGIITMVAMSAVLLLTAALSRVNKAPNQPKVTDLGSISVPQPADGAKVPAEAKNSNQAPLNPPQSSTDWPPPDSGYSVEMNATDLRLLQHLTDTGGASNEALVRTFEQFDPAAQDREGYGIGSGHGLEPILLGGIAVDIRKIDSGVGAVYQSILAGGARYLVVFSLAKPDLIEKQGVGAIGYLSDHTVRMADGTSARVLITRAIQTDAQFDAIARQVFPDWNSSR